MVYKITYIIFIIGILPLLSACRTEEMGSELLDNKVRFELFTRADSYGLPVSRASADENTVDKQPWVLVFSGSDGNAVFVEAAKAFEANGRSYVDLELQTGACQLLVLTSQQGYFYIGTTSYEFSVAGFNAALKSPASTLSNACANLLTVPLSSPQTSVPFVPNERIPMSDLVAVSKIDVSVTIPQINLKRVVGKLIVKNTDPGFELLGVTAVVNTPKHTTLYNPTTTPGTVASGNLISYHRNNAYATDMVSATAVSGGQSTEENPLYLYESNCGTNNTYIVIKGSYKGEVGYYKMALVDNSGNVLNIVRNREYIMTITSAEARGYYSVADAMVSKPSNTDLNSEILVQDLSAYEIMSNNDYYLGVTNSHFELYAAPSNSVSYTAFSLYTDCAKVFPDKRNVTVSSSSPLMEITAPADGKIPVNSSASYDVKIKVLSGFTEGEIELHLGNLKKIITVRRQDAVSGPGSGTNIISEFIPGGAYYVSAYITYARDYFGNPSDWLQLSPGGEAVRNDPYHIYVDNGRIDLHYWRRSQAAGELFVATRGYPVQRIRVHITHRLYGV